MTDYSFASFFQVYLLLCRQILQTFLLYGSYYIYMYKILTIFLIHSRPAEEHNSDKMWYRDSFVDDFDEIDALNDIKNF